MFARTRGIASLRNVAAAVTAIAVPPAVSGGWIDPNVWQPNLWTHLPPLLCEEDKQQTTTPHPNLGRRVSGLPSYKFSEISKHKNKGESVWVTFEEGVYDITDFIEKHPGGDKILLGAGGSVDRYWKLYGQHLSLPHISHMMEEMRIGNIDEADYQEAKKLISLSANENDPYRVDASIDRHPGLVFLTERPANAEVPPSLLCESFLTPNELFFVRHHFPVPPAEEPGADTVTLSGAGFSKSMSVKEFREKFNQHSVVATIQCTGNRRTGFHSVEGTPGKVKGLPWTIGAISNAKWTGVRLRDVILDLFPDGVIPPEIKHVCFIGRDNDGSGQHYGASIQLDRALDERSDVLLAFEMNDEPLPLDHGYPIRLIVPGAAGCRSVKWVKSIELSPTESTAFWQKEDYKSFNPSQGWEGLDFNSAPSVMSTPVQSAVCDVAISQDANYAVVKGYSFSGGGLGIIRVDVSADGGQTWTTASELNGEHDDVTNLPYRRTYSWTLWTAVVDLPPQNGSVREFVVKAVDEGYNSQPEKADGVWNVRGILNNSWHRYKW